MDPRHETKSQEFFNELIIFINYSMQKNPGELLSDTQSLSALQTIVKYIYRYANMWVDVENTLSAKNLLSKDVVLLPLISALILKREFDGLSFNEVIIEIQTLISSNLNHSFFVDLKEVVNKTLVKMAITI